MSLLRCFFKCQVIQWEQTKEQEKQEEEVT